MRDGKMKFADESVRKNRKKRKKEKEGIFFFQPTHNTHTHLCTPTAHQSYKRILSSF